jgi:hypothetical protein
MIPENAVANEPRLFVGQVSLSATTYLPTCGWLTLYEPDLPIVWHSPAQIFVIP